MTARRRDALLLTLILLLTAIKGVLWSAAVPLWQGPDEDRHFATVQFIAEHGRLPGTGEVYHDDENVISGELAEVSRLWYNPEQRQNFGPGDQGPNEAAIANLDPRLRTSTERGKVTLALHLPPLYYLLGVLFYLPVRAGDLLARVFAVRQLSVLLSVGAVACAYLAAREVFPQRRAMWFTVPVLVSFQPMFTLSTAVVNTDALLIVVFCALIWLSVRTLRKPLSLGRAIGMGALFGAGLLTKPFILAMAPPLALVAGWEWYRVRHDQRDRGRRALLVWGIVAAVALLVWSPWVVHSARLGSSPFYANPIRTGQLKVEHPFYDYALGHYLIDYAVSLFGGTWASFWGYFGWVDTPLDRSLYAMLYVVCGTAAIGLGLYGARWARRQRGREQEHGRQGRMEGAAAAADQERARTGGPLESAATAAGEMDWDGEAGLLGYLALCAGSVVATLGAINFYSWRARGVGGGIQGRYYLGAIVPVGMLLAVGLLELLPERWRPAGHWLLCWAAIVLNGIAFMQVLLPRYYL